MSQPASEIAQSKQGSSRSSGLLNLILGRFLRLQRGPSKNVHTGAQAASLEADQQTSEQALSSLPDPCVAEAVQDAQLGDQVAPLGLQGVRRSATHLASTRGRESTVPAGSLQVSAIISDIEGSSDWNFSRRSGRSQRSAREWARKSSVGHSGSQLSDAVSPGNLEDNADSHQPRRAGKQQNTPAEENINRPTLVASQGTPRRYLTRGHGHHENTVREEPAQPAVDDVVPHKRKSVEAGLDNGRGQGDRRSLEKIGKLDSDHPAQLSDFYPSELQERSLLFNSQYLSPQ